MEVKQCVFCNNTKVIKVTGLTETGFRETVVAPCIVCQITKIIPELISHEAFKKELDRLWYMKDSSDLKEFVIAHELMLRTFIERSGCETCRGTGKVDAVSSTGDEGCPDCNRRKLRTQIAKAKVENEKLKRELFENAGLAETASIEISSLNSRIERLIKAGDRLYEAGDDGQVPRAADLARWIVAREAK